MPPAGIRTAAAAGKPFDVEFRVVRPDGSIRWVWDRGYPATLSGGTMAYVGVAQDITERKKAEEKYACFFEEDLAANYIGTPDGRLIRCNSAFVRMFGFDSREEALACPTARFYSRPADRLRFLDLLLERRQIYGLETDLRRKDGSTIHVIQNVSGSFNERGELEEISGHFIDDTERRLKDAALNRRSAELARSNAELEQFAYVASHDLQEPLRMVSSYTQLLARRYKGKLDSDADEFIEFAVDGAKRMQNLINDLLAYSRLGTKGGTFRETASADAVKSALRNLAAAIEGSGAHIECGSLPAVWADPTQLMLLFQNLVGNAIKYRGAEPPCVGIECGEESGAWAFTVRDNGIGIEPRYQERIFQVFQRLHSRQLYPGTGIGLAICKKIVERHGGRIRVESEAGCGAAFHFTIPKRAEESRGSEL